MAKLIPVQTRRSMIAAVQRGESIPSVAARFEVTPQGLAKIIHTTRARGSLQPLKSGVIERATMLLDGPMNALTFLGWV
jgi:transposase-like protein